MADYGLWAMGGCSWVLKSSLSQQAGAGGGRTLRSLHWAYTATPGGDHLHNCGTDVAFGFGAMRRGISTKKRSASLGSVFFPGTGSGGQQTNDFVAGGWVVVWPAPSRTPWVSGSLVSTPVDHRGGGGRSAAGARYQLARWPFALEAASRIPARIRLKGTPAGMPELATKSTWTPKYQQRR